MQIKYLVFMQKYVAIYKGKALAVGDTMSEAIAQGVEVIKNNQKKYIWSK